jgi:hypothetical protein
MMFRKKYILPKMLLVHLAYNRFYCGFCLFMTNANSDTCTCITNESL